MRLVAGLCAILTLSPAGSAQTAAMLSAGDADQLFKRTVQLMESTAIAMPGMSRAAAPLMENTKQSLTNLAVTPQNSAVTYDFLNNVRAYLVLTDASPKPYPFPDEARKQFSELRDSVDRIESHFRALLDQKERQVRNPDRDNLKRYAEANERLSPPASDQPRVVFLGDSITDGWRLNEYFTGRDFANRGISGQITGEMLGRMKADVIDLKPKAVLILAGTNDIARGVSTKTIEDNLTMIAELAQLHHIKPMFSSILPISDYHKDVNPRFEMSRLRAPQTILEVNNWLQQFCAQHGYTYVNYFSAMVDQSGFLKAELADDGLHPNAMGYRVMAPVALASIDREVLAPAPVVSSRSRKQREPKAEPRSKDLAVKPDVKPKVKEQVQTADAKANEQAQTADAATKPKEPAPTSSAKTKPKAPAQTSDGKPKKKRYLGIFQ